MLYNTESTVVAVECYCHYPPRKKRFWWTCDNTDLHKVSTWLLCVSTLAMFTWRDLFLSVYTLHTNYEPQPSLSPSPSLSLRLNIFLLTVRLSTARHQSLELLLWRIIESVVSSNTLLVAHTSTSGRESASLDPLASVQKDEFHTLELLRRIYVVLKIQQINCDQMIRGFYGGWQCNCY